ncbi:MAG: peptidase [Bacteroidetes bacterium]|nr:MAG: peptidase [Bacteroidota bacterium]PTM11561.1 MAG: peptidase [Bacteroidota bacterium]
MTYCLGIKTKTGFVGIADTRITSGNSTAQARKVFTVNEEKHTFFIMTSGLRSVRDKAMTYFRETIDEQEEPFNKLYKVVNAFADEVKRVAVEDKKSLKEAGLDFNLFSIIGGQLEKDDEHKIYLLYPEGNWVEVAEGSPFVIIGNNGYGKPILDRAIKYTSSLKFALKAGFLSFDATRISANDVDYPIDVLYYEKDSFRIVEKRYRKEDLTAISRSWGKSLRNSIDSLPDDWLDKLTE